MIRKTIGVVVLSILAFSGLQAQFSLSFSQDSTPTAPDHIGLDTLLQKYVSETGQVNYKGLKSEKNALYAYCQLLGEHPVQDAWTPEVKMVYWINTYNAFTLRLIVDNYPVKSILQFDGGKTWDVKRIALGNKKYSLNQIENDILRPRFKDPRIHFAINCAAKSCPPLYNHAWQPETLDSVLEVRTRTFINDPKFNTVKASKISVSKIFDWYGADFGDLRQFLNRYAATPAKPSAKIIFQEYDWGLNE